MKKVLIRVVMICVIFTSFTFTKVNALELESESAIVIDAKTGQILYEKNKNQKNYPASITKILSGFVAIQEGDFSDVLTVSDTAVNSISRTSSHIFLVEGEQMSFEDAMHAMMLQSANDASNAIAEYTSSTIEAFVSKMNETAQEIGMTNSNFANAHGLPDDNHYTTAYDMAILMKEAIKNPELLEIMSTVQYTMPETNKNEERYFAAGNELFKPSEFKYDYAIAGKTGYTAAAGYTLVTVAEKEGAQLIAVVLDSTLEGRYEDTTKLFEYGFTLFESRQFSKDLFEPVEKDISTDKYRKVTATATVENDIDIHVLKNTRNDDLTFEISTVDLIDEENATAKAVIKNNNEVIYEVDAVVTLEIEELDWKDTFPYLIMKSVITLFSITGFGLLLAQIRKRNKRKR